MLHIVLLILKIIGIILGVLLGVVLLCLCLALFVPVRYKVEARREKDAMPVEVRAKVTWLLHLLNIRLIYSEKLQLRARIFLFTVLKLPKEEKTGTASHKKRKKRKEKAETSDAVLHRESKEEPVVTHHENERKEADKTLQEEAPAKDGKKGKFSIKKLLLKIYRFFQNIWYTIIGICDRIKKIWENIEYYVDVLQSEPFKQSFALCKEELASIFSYIKPRRLQADLVIGMDDPAATAKILSYYGMLYPVIGNHVTISPDFDEKRIEGTALIQGKIRLFTFLKAVVRIYFSKDIKRLLKLLKKEDI